MLTMLLFILQQFLISSSLHAQYVSYDTRVDDSAEFVNIHILNLLIILCELLIESYLFFKQKEFKLDYLILSTTWLIDWCY